MSGHPPAWYRDPERADRVRRWDGRSWTADVRPAPPWVAPLRVAPGPRARPRPPAQPLWLMSFVLAVLAMGAFVVVRFPSTSVGPVVADRAFIRGAADVCDRAQEDIRAIGGRLDRADRLDALVGVVEPMVDELARVPVKPGDAELVERWISWWRRFVDLGQAEAEALADGDIAEADELEREASRPKAEIDRFALANGITPCVLVS